MFVQAIGRGRCAEMSPFRCLEIWNVRELYARTTDIAITVGVAAGQDTEGSFVKRKF